MSTARDRGERSGRRLQWLASALLALGLPGLPPALMLSWLAIAITLLAGLKLLEARRLQERRLVTLLQLVSAGLQGALQPDLAPSLLQGAAVLVALAGLLALESGERPDWPLLLRRSLKVVLAALPMALALFLLLPRLGPFSPIAGLLGPTGVTGLSETLAPGSIATLVNRATPAARVTFGAGGPPPEAERYWRVLVHQRFDGESWMTLQTRRPRPFDAATPEAGSAATLETLEADDPGLQLWVAEASGLETVPWSGRGRALAAAARVTPQGGLRHTASPLRRRLYALAAEQGRSEWQQRAPDAWDLQMPRGANPRLEALGAQWRLQGGTAERLAAAERWFRSQPFTYSRTPGTLARPAPLDRFLFERRSGFCGHYASAFTALMRAAGVPARVVSGYRGGDWVVPLGGPPYLDLRQDDAHAWSEVWLEGEGWRRVDPTAWVVPSAPSGPPSTAVATPTWIARQWWGLDLAWSRWWLRFDRGSQAALLSWLLRGRLELAGLLVLAAVGAGLAAGLALMRWSGAGPQGDPPARELARLLALLTRHGLEPHPGETLPGLAARLGGLRPDLRQPLAAMVEPYEAWRHGPGGSRPEEGRRLTALLRRQRRQLARVLGGPAGRGPAGGIGFRPRRWLEP